MRFETRSIRDGQEPDPRTGCITVPVYQTSTFKQDGLGLNRGFEYSRSGNPTREALETSIASLEGGAHGLAFASGVAASTAVISLLGPGDHVVACNDIYGGTFRLLDKVFSAWGITTSFADTADPADFERNIRDNTRLIWIESPTNPLLRLADIAAVSTVAKRKGVLLAVDNTFASPYFQRPLELGADIVVHSSTKYLGGHSDLIGGLVALRDSDLFERLKFYQNSTGAVPGPWDCWLTLRGIRTLSCRMREHSRIAAYLAHVLEGHEKIARVWYPGLESHPEHALAKRQMGGFGGMLSIELKGGISAVERFISKLDLFILAESLGGVESLVSHPWTMTHAALSAQEKLSRDIREGLLRLSVGLENELDLQDELLGALETV